MRLVYLWFDTLLRSTHHERTKNITFLDTPDAFVPSILLSISETWVYRGMLRTRLVYLYSRLVYLYSRLVYLYCRLYNSISSSVVVASKADLSDR